MAWPNLSPMQIQALTMLSAFGCFDLHGGVWRLGHRRIAKATATTLTGRGFTQMKLSEPVQNVRTVPQLSLTRKGVDYIARLRGDITLEAAIERSFAQILEAAE